MINKAKKTKIKQGTLLWEKARATRIGGSEVFDIVRYYATDDELWNCGFNAENFRDEAPYTTAWALYHKILNDGMYHREALAPEYAEYGHAVEPYGVYFLNKCRARKVKAGEVYLTDKLVASLDVAGVAEEVDIVPFAYGEGTPVTGQRFVCEQKSMNPVKVKAGVPFKYIVQAQYQIEMTKADFFVLQIMILKEDTPFIRGKICQMGRKARYKYLDENMDVKLLYFKSNEHLSQLIKVCLERFFADVELKNEPTPFIETDSQRNIIESIRINSAYDPKKEITLDLSLYSEAKKSEDEASVARKAELQRIVEAAKKNNACIFKSPNGTTTAKFSKNGSFLLKEREKAV